MQKWSDVMNDMRVSMARLEKARPIIRRLLNGGEIHPVEGDDNKICQILDQTCGMDYLQVYKDRNLTWGIASRIQTYNPASKPFNSFTVRKARESGAATEYEKRRDAIARGGIYPYLTMQAYVNEDTGEIDSLAIARTVDIMDFVDSGKASERHTKADKIGQAAFFVAYWDDLEKSGYKVLRYDANDFL